MTLWAIDCETEFSNHEIIKLLQRSHGGYKGLYVSGTGILPLMKPILFLEMRAILKDLYQE